MNGDLMISIFSIDTLMILRGIIPCLAAILIGYLIGGGDNAKNEKTLSSLKFFIFSPCLVFIGIHRHKYHFSEVGVLALAAIFIVLVLVLPAFVVWKSNKNTERGYILPIIFASTGSIFLPLSYLLYGSEGLAKAALFHLVSLFFFYTFGTWLVDGRMQPGRFFRNPTVFAAIFAIISTEFNISLPASLEGFFRLVEHGIDIVGYGAIPVLCLGYGYTFYRIDRSTIGKGLSGGLIRMLAGPLAAFLIVLLFRQLGFLSMAKDYNILDYISGRTTEAVIVLAGTIPGAISSYFVNQRNDLNTAADTLAILTASTLIGIISIPITLFIINRFILSA